MRFWHYSPGELTREQVRRVVQEYCLLYPDICGGLNVDDRVAKLQKLAHAVFAFSSDKKVAGFIFFYCNSETRIAFITSIGRLSSTEAGVGIALHREYENFVASQGMNRSRLEVGKMNSRAIAFYRKRGYISCEEKDHSFLMEMNIGETSK